MALIVQHNLTAMNSNRQLGITTNSQAKSSEKLSSGYRINRAGDDAAGLTISEKMRSQIRGLSKASSNAQDGVSLIQTAEGALNEAHSILQRMNELAVQGANDTNENIDRDAINQELTALTEELDRISTTTQFNKQNLLDGSFKDKNLQIGANANQNLAININNMNAQTLGLRKITGAEPVDEIQKGKSPTDVKYNNYTYAYDKDKSIASNKTLAISNFKVQISGAAASNQYALQMDSTSFYYVDTADNKYATVASAKTADISAAKNAMATAVSANFPDYLNTEDVEAAGPTVAVSAKDFDLASPDVSTYAKANATLTAVQNAINSVSTQRSALGALQNRLEHTISNLDNVAENAQAAESRIRDVDMASEMVEYSKNNILAQAGQSMLAQANQSTQGVLSLLG